MPEQKSIKIVINHNGEISESEVKLPDWSGVPQFTSADIIRRPYSKETFEKLYLCSFENEMLCKYCQIKMVPGTAIKPAWPSNARFIIPPKNITADTLEIIKVLKCPKCGHSDDGEDNAGRSW